MNSTLTTSSKTWIQANFPNAKFNYDEDTRKYQVIVDNEIVGESDNSSVAYSAEKFYLQTFKTAKDENS